MSVLLSRRRSRRKWHGVPAAALTTALLLGGLGIGGHPAGASDSANRVYVDDADSAWSWTGSWSHEAGESWAAQDAHGTETYSDTADDTASLAFDGTGIVVWGAADPNRGMVSVRIDDEQPLVVDQYAKQRKEHRVVFSRTGLADGPHTVTLTVLGSANPAATDRYVDVDGASVLPATDNPDDSGVDPGTSAATKVLDDANVGPDSWTFGSSWSQVSGDAYPGDLDRTESYSNTPGDVATLHFFGTGVTVYGASDPNRGRLRFVLDGKERSFDQYAPHRAEDVELFGQDDLERTDHVLVIEATGEHDDAATDAYADIDYAEVNDDGLGSATFAKRLQIMAADDSDEETTAGDAPATEVRPASGVPRVTDDLAEAETDWAPNDSRAITHTAGWSIAETDDPKARLGERASSDRAGERLTLSFFGDRFRLEGPQGPDGGTADVYEDCAPVGTIDSYAPAPTSGNVLYSDDHLARGQHTVVVVPTGRRDDASSGTRVTVDTATTGDTTSAYADVAPVRSGPASSAAFAGPVPLRPPGCGTSASLLAQLRARVSQGVFGLPNADWQPTTPLAGSTTQLGAVNQHAPAVGGSGSVLVDTIAQPVATLPVDEHGVALPIALSHRPRTAILQLSANANLQGVSPVRVQVTDRDGNELPFYAVSGTRADPSVRKSRELTWGGADGVFPGRSVVLVVDLTGARAEDPGAGNGANDLIVVRAHRTDDSVTASSELDVLAGRTSDVVASRYAGTLVGADVVPPSSVDNGDHPAAQPGAFAHGPVVLSRVLADAGQPAWSGDTAVPIAYGTTPDGMPPTVAGQPLSSDSFSVTVPDDGNVSLTLPTRGRCRSLSFGVGVDDSSTGPNDPPPALSLEVTGDGTDLPMRHNGTWADPLLPNVDSPLASAAVRRDVADAVDASADPLAGELPGPFGSSAATAWSATVHEIAAALRDRRDDASPASMDYPVPNPLAVNPDATDPGADGTDTGPADSPTAQAPTQFLSLTDTGATLPGSTAALPSGPLPLSVALFTPTDLDALRATATSPDGRAAAMTNHAVQQVTLTVTATPGTTVDFSDAGMDCGAAGIAPLYSQLGVSPSFLPAPKDGTGHAQFAYAAMPQWVDELCPDGPSTAGLRFTAKQQAVAVVGGYGRYQPIATGTGTFPACAPDGDIAAADNEESTWTWDGEHTGTVDDSVNDALIDLRDNRARALPDSLQVGTPVADDLPAVAPYLDRYAVTPTALDATFANPSPAVRVLPRGPVAGAADLDHLRRITGSTLTPEQASREANAGRIAVVPAASGPDLAVPLGDDGRGADAALDLDVTQRIVDDTATAALRDTGRRPAAEFDDVPGVARPDEQLHAGCLTFSSLPLYQLEYPGNSLVPRAPTPAPSPSASNAPRRVVCSAVVPNTTHILAAAVNHPGWVPAVPATNDAVYAGSTYGADAPAANASVLPSVLPSAAPSASGPPGSTGTNWSPYGTAWSSYGTYVSSNPGPPLPKKQRTDQAPSQNAPSPNAPSQPPVPAQVNPIAAQWQQPLGIDGMLAAAGLAIPTPPTGSSTPEWYDTGSLSSHPLSRFEAQHGVWFVGEPGAPGYEGLAGDADAWKAAKAATDAAAGAPVAVRYYRPVWADRQTRVWKRAPLVLNTRRLKMYVFTNAPPNLTLPGILAREFRRGSSAPPSELDVRAGNPFTDFLDSGRFVIASLSPWPPPDRDGRVYRITVMTAGGYWLPRIEFRRDRMGGDDEGDWVPSPPMLAFPYGIPGSRVVRISVVGENLALHRQEMTYSWRNTGYDAAANGPAPALTNEELVGPPCSSEFCHWENPAALQAVNVLLRRHALRWPALSQISGDPARPTVFVPSRLAYEPVELAAWGLTGADDGRLGSMSVQGFVEIGVLGSNLPGRPSFWVPRLFLRRNLGLLPQLSTSRPPQGFTARYYIHANRLPDTPWTYNSVSALPTSAPPPTPSYAPES